MTLQEPSGVPSDKVLVALRELLDLLIRSFGPKGTILLVFLFLLALFAARFYKDWRADKAIDKALAEKERTIQRLANQERTWRKVFLTKGLKLDAHEADKILQIEGDFEDAKQSRKALESRKRK